MFEYTLKGIVSNGDGLSLALYYSDQNLDDRTTVKIQNGEFTFHGSCDYMKELYIRFEKNIDNPSGYHRTLVHTEPGVITIRFDVTSDPSYYRFSNFEVLTGPDNIFRRQFFTEYNSNNKEEEEKEKKDLYAKKLHKKRIFSSKVYLKRCMDVYLFLTFSHFCTE